MRLSVWVPAAVSTVVHVVVAVALVTHTPTPPPPGVAAPVGSLVPPPVEAEPLEVEFISDVPAIAAIDPASISTPSVASISTATRSRAETAATGAEDATPLTPTPTLTGQGTDSPRNRYMDMRRNEVDLHLPGHTFDDREWVPKGTDAQQPIDSGRLRGAGNGTYQSHEGQVVATVDADGNVKLGNKKNFHAHVALPSAHEVGDVLQAWYYDDNKPVGTLAPAHPPEDLQMGNGEVVSVPAHGVAIVPPTAQSNAGRISDDGTVPMIGGGFDITDAFMRKHGQDPYASAKLTYLDSTRDERVEIGMKHRSEQLSHVAQLVQKNLAVAWSIRDAAERKRALFEMWDECVETGSEEMIGASMQARHLVIGFIRGRLPAGSAGAFTRSELAAFNREKQSTATFSPYE
ncbi:hypothetical protein BH11MYX2_BH11MYX2_07300 [soil metagenome]